MVGVFVDSIIVVLVLIKLELDIQLIRGEMSQNVIISHNNVMLTAQESPHEQLPVHNASGTMRKARASIL